MNTASCFISKRFKIFKKRRSIDVFQNFSGLFVCEYGFNLDFSGGEKVLSCH